MILLGEIRFRLPFPLESVFAPLVDEIRSADPQQQVAAMSDLNALRQELEKAIR